MDNEIIVSDIRYHTRRVIDEVLKDHSFIYNGKCIYVEQKYGYKNPTFIIVKLPIEMRPNENQFLDYFSCDTIDLYEKKEDQGFGAHIKAIPRKEDFHRVFYSENPEINEGTNQYFFTRLKERGASLDNIYDRCVIEAEMFEIANNNDCVTQIDLSELSKGIIKTDKGILTKENYQGKYRFLSSVKFSQEICGIPCAVSISERDWYSGKTGNFIQVTIQPCPKIPGENMNESYRSAYSKEILINYNCIRHVEGIRERCDWGYISIPLLGGGKSGEAGFIVITIYDKK